MKFTAELGAIRFIDRERLPGALDGAALVEELEHVPLVRLIPRDLHRRDRAEVQALDEVAEGEELAR